MPGGVQSPPLLLLRATVVTTTATNVSGNGNGNATGTDARNGNGNGTGTDARTSVLQLVSDGSWKTYTGPIISDSVYQGEQQDFSPAAAADVDGDDDPLAWTRPGFDDSSWKNATVRTQAQSRGVPKPRPTHSASAEVRSVSCPTEVMALPCDAQPR